MAATTEAEAQAAGNQVIQALDDVIIETGVALGYVWHSADVGRSVRYGVPDRDDGALRVDCVDGRLLIAISIETDGAEGEPSSALFSNGDRREGTIGYLGDGAKVLIPVAVDDPVVATLLAEERIAIDTPQTVVRVPATGGTGLLRSLIERCVPQRP
jgi:hypothetical protein